MAEMRARLANLVYKISNEQEWDDLHKDHADHLIGTWLPQWYSSPGPNSKPHEALNRSPHTLRADQVPRVTPLFSHTAMQPTTPAGCVLVAPEVPSLCAPAVAHVPLLPVCAPRPRRPRASATSCSRPRWAQITLTFHPLTLLHRPQQCSTSTKHGAGSAK